MKSMLKSLMSVAAAALALTSCSTDATEEAISKGELKTLKVNATIDQTRTVMADDHVKLNWSDGDEIYLYIGPKAAKADVKKIDPASGVTIKDVTYKEGDMVYANYSLDNSYSDGVTKAEIKIDANQTQSEANVFAGKNLPMVAKSPIKNGAVDLTFQPVGCVLVFNVYGSAYNANEQIKSIKFETTVGCCGYQKCDLTAAELGYVAYEKGTSATVTLTTPATIGVQKPSDTKIGENQVYLVVAPVNYEAATITVNTTIDPQKGDIFNTYTFTTPSGIDCSQYTARVVNLNLERASVVPSIDVPTVPQQVSDGGDLVIENIVFKNIAADAIANAEVGVFSDAELINQDNVDWLTIQNPSSVATGVLNCKVAANTTTESRTAYIGIKCGDVQVAIPVTQVAAGASTDKYYVKVTENLTDWTGDYLIVYDGTDGTLALNGALSVLDAVNNYIEVEITEQGILSTNTTNASLVKISKIDGSTDKYILQAASEQYLYSEKYENKLKYSSDYNTAAKYPNTINIEGDGSATIKSSTNATMRFNAKSDQMRFRYYKSGQQPVQLYKLQ